MKSVFLIILCLFLLTGCSAIFNTVDEVQASTSFSSEQTIITNTPVPSPSPTPSPTPHLLTIPADNTEIFELPVIGACGYTVSEMPLLDSVSGNTISTLPSGTPFFILDENDNYWQIETMDGTSGWVDNAFCMINLPDVLPSIVYDNTNSYSSVLKSSGYDIPDVTGEALYTVPGYNIRLGKEVATVPVLYTTAKKIAQVQKNALSQGNCLIIYEAYRPHETQQLIHESLSALVAENAEVTAGIAVPPWDIGSFIHPSISNHQKGFAVDVSLGKIESVEDIQIGEYVYHEITATEYSMPSPIHELSTRAVTYNEPISQTAITTMESPELSEGMKNNPYAITLQDYCIQAGLTPISSEWWHFNDLDAREETLTNPGVGDFFITNCLSQPLN